MNAKYSLVLLSGIALAVSLAGLSTTSASLTNSTFNDLVQEAFQNSQLPYAPPTIASIPELDPPADGNKESVGLVFEEYEAIKGDKFYDDHIWWVEARPRGSFVTEPVKIYLYKPDSSGYIEIPYDETKYDYSDSTITPAIGTVPADGKYIGGFKLGHKIQGQDSWPLILELRGSGYIRFSREPPLQMGSTFRVAAHNICALNEDFPKITKVYLKRLSDSVFNIMALVDSEGFTGALDIYVYPGANTKLHVQAKYFPRRDILIATEPHTGFAAYSSMFWQDEDATPEDSTDEAHDADFFVVGYNDGSIRDYKITNPPGAGEQVITDFAMANKAINYFALEQWDRLPEHYSKYDSAKYADRSSYRLKLASSSIPLTVMLHESHTNDEYYDNIIANLAITQDLHKAQRIEDAISLVYTTEAYTADYFREGEDWASTSGGGYFDYKPHASGSNTWHLPSSGESVIYSDIPIRWPGSVYFWLRYADDVGGDALSIYLNNDLKGSFTTIDTGQWDDFLWSSRINLGTTVSGTHEIKIISSGPDTWGVNLDCFSLCVLLGDFDGDAQVTVADIQQAASHWRCKCGDACYDPRYDVDGDCDIDIVDIMKVAAHWGEGC